jgi:hypothetical protein
MSQKTINTFQDGMNLDIADLMMKNSLVRFAQNIRIVNLEGRSFLITNLQGTERKFTISTGFKAIATEEYNGVLYIISKSETQLEIGSYPSVDPSSGGNIWVYRPLNNLTGGLTVGGVANSFRLDLSALGLPSGDLVLQKIVIQPDYDRSVNILFTIKGYKPRIVNSKFVVTNSGGNIALSYSPTRPGNANSNQYSTSSVDDETSTILYSTKILKLALNSISTGGKLKPGNYTYVFHYMTEDFNQTNVVGQSSICQIAFGDSEFTRKGGDETQETDKRVLLNLTNVDTEFQYLKVYCLYSSGQEAVTQQYLEFTQPIQIIGEVMTFIHSGYEELAEVAADTVNVDYSTIEGADCSTQVSGYYFMGGIKERSFDYTQFRAAAAGVTPIFKSVLLPATGLPGYADPSNVYNYMGSFGNETYPYGMVFIMNDGTLSPVFPTKGANIVSSAGPSVVHHYEGVPAPGQWYKGLVTFPSSNHYVPYDNGVRVKALDFSLATIPDYIKQNSIGFFFVRGERKSNLITQGILIPTFKAPVIEDFSTDDDSNNTYWERFKDNIEDNNFFKYLPCLDSMIEAYRKEVRGDAGETNDDKNVLDADNRIKDGYMPIFINDLKNMDNHKGGWTSTSNPEIWFAKQQDTWARHWALLSGDALLNEPFFVTQLQRDNLGVQQLGKIQFRVQGLISPLFAGDISGAESPTQTGLKYDFSSIIPYSAPSIKTSRRISFVPGEALATGSDFVSKLAATLYFEFINGSPDKEIFYHVYTQMNAFFGVEMEEGAIGQLADSEKGAANPIGGNARIGSRLFGAKSDASISNNITSGVRYTNYNTLVNGAFLVNIYNSPTVPSADDLFPTIDNVAYRQVSPRYAWSDVPMNNLISVFGGDCYIAKAYRKLNQSGSRNAAIREPDPNLRRNIDQGQLVSWWQEAKYNLNLRQPKLFDASESEERSFFPYQSRGDFNEYRGYRYPETVSHSQGYSELLQPKSFFPLPSLAPYIENYFFSRIAHSARHIPNAFRNGFRSFLPGNYKDYDSSMGQITGMFNLRGNLLVIFEHGIGMTAIEQRVPVGGDAAGAIFLKPSEILPTTLSYVSREIGSQDNLSLVQTPGAVYGVDRSRCKIWKMSMDGLKVISDDTVSSWLVINSPVKPRSGYDFVNSEVIFCTDNWTLAYREGLERFVSFYSLGSAPNLLARRENDMYSFIDHQAWIHNAPVYTIYEQEKDVIIEMVVNDNITTTKVYDFINIISNEVPPSKVEFYTYNQEEAVEPTINLGATNQYAKIDYGVDVITEEPNILYRDKRFVAQIPYREGYNPGSASDPWGIEARIRDKYLIIRLTYRTNLSLQLASVITSLRYSYS